MNKLGIDQSYTSSGICVVDKDSQLLHFERFKSNADEDTYARALAISLKLCELIDNHNISDVQLEGLAFGIRGNATRDLAGLLFTIINVIKLKHPTVKCTVVAPTSVKKFATGSGKADKAAMIAALPDNIRQRFEAKGFKSTTGLADLADAYWISQIKSS